MVELVEPLGRLGLLESLDWLVLRELQARLELAEPLDWLELGGSRARLELLDRLESSAQLGQMVPLARLVRPDRLVSQVQLEPMDLRE